MALVLTVINGDTHRTLRFERDVVTLGRDPGNAIALDDPALSRTHCQFERLGATVYVRDLNSRNGTWVEGAPVTRKRLVKGTEVSLGTARVRFDGIEEGRRRGPGLAGIRVGSRSPRKEGRRDLKEENRRLRELLEVARNMLSELDQDRVLAGAIDTAVDLTGAERGFLVVFRGDDMSVEVARNYWRRDVDDPEVEVSRHVAERVRAEGVPLMLEDASDDSRFREFLSVHALKLRSVLCVPIKAHSEVRGVIYLDNRFVRGSFTGAHLDLLRQFADLAAVALENSGRFAEEAREKQALREEVAMRREEALQARLELARREGEIRLRYRYENIVAHSPAMQELLRLADRVIPTDLPVLLEGAVGTGKETLARTIHENGPRAGRPFVVVSCAALPASLAEVELFGHGSGAYTGAGASRGGLLEEAHEGSLYLDGVEDLDRETQALFLRILESGELRRVGETDVRPVDVRFIAAASCSLEALVREGRFREDLYFRLKAVRLRLPTLAERPEDLPEMLEHLVEQEAPGLQLTPAARKALLLRPWPGNLLELRNEVRRLASLGEETVDTRHLGPAFPGEGGDLREAVERLEKSLIVRALQRHQGNRTRAAQELGLSRLGLRNKIQRYGLLQQVPPATVREDDG